MERVAKQAEVWFWFYKENAKNYPGIHFTARESGCEVLLKRLQDWDAGIEPKMTLELPELDPKDEAKISGGQEFRCFRKVKIARADQLDPILVEQFREERLLSITLNTVGQETLTRIINEVMSGHGDQGTSTMSKRATDITFSPSSLMWWPCFGHMWVVP